MSSLPLTNSIIFQDGYIKPPTRYQFPMSPGFPWISNGPGFAHQRGGLSAEIQVRATPRRNAADGRTPGATCVGPGVLRAEVSPASWADLADLVEGMKTCCHAHMLHVIMVDLPTKLGDF